MTKFKYRFVITTYNDADVVLSKDILMSRLNAPLTDFTFESRQYGHTKGFVNFWIDVTFPRTLKPDVALFEILTVFRDAIGRDSLTYSLETKIPNDNFRCVDKNIPVSKLAFGLLSSPFEFQTVCHIDPNKQQYVHLENFIDNFQQIFHISFFHDQRYLKLSMPMIDEMDKHRNRLRLLQKNQRSESQREARELKEFIDAKNEPPGHRREYNEVIIKLEYQNVKLVIFDVVSCDCDAIECNIFIIYEHPPLLHIYPLSHVGGRLLSFAPRYVRWSESFSLQDFLGPMVQSSAMKIQTRMVPDEFYSLISMFQLRLSCSVVFRKVKTAQVSIHLAMKDRSFKNNWPFEIQYLVDCILSRGSIGQKYILGTKKNYQHIHTHIETLLRGKNGLFNAKKFLLDMFLTVVQADMDSALTDYKEGTIRRRFEDNIDDPNYISIRKAIVTPTRVLYYPPEPSMGCRLIREFGPDRFLRVLFREDTMDLLHNCYVAFIKDTVSCLKNGLEVGGEKFHYLGYSNSQLRDQGCYFYRAKRVDDLIAVYDSMGQFKDEGVAKTMARFAQCFTQSYPSKIELPLDCIDEIPDYTNSATDSKDKKFCFSDGVGVMSLATAKDLQNELCLPFTPSCFQFRYAGYKGVVSVDPYMTEFAEFVKTNNIDIDRSKTPWMKAVLFRPSQNKFTANEKHIGFEVVKYSTPCVMHLNKQLINIFDQVAAKQSQIAHSNIIRRVLQLTDIQIDSIMKSLTDEEAFRIVLRDLPAIVPYRKLRGFHSLVVEPFFRRLCLAWAKMSLKFLSEKARIPVPPNFGRNMLGIVDETGFLQYGQVFVQYSESVHEQSTNTNKIILTGDVMVTKNPMMSGGDLRKFTAINIPALQHLYDVIVFSHHGPRPSPDEMAGSDLDGDEYSVIWDPELMLDYNEPPMNYTTPSADGHEMLSRFSSNKRMLQVREQSIDFFTNYLLNDSIGVVANAHLANSDLYGLENKVCHSIALKQIAAVDFAKSGIPMQGLRKHWNYKEPPEQVERFPNFMQKDHCPFYQSNRLLGRVYRKVQQFVDSVSTFIDVDDDFVVLDEGVDIDGWEEYEKQAEDAFECYTDEVQRLLINFGVKNEAELFSSCFTDMKFRNLKNQEADNLSGFSTTSLIQKHLYGILARYRLEFFADTVGGIDKNPKDKRLFFHTRYSHVLTLNLRRKAVAYYKIAYRKGQFLSFPWVVWDVIDVVSMEKRTILKRDPRGEYISTEIAHFSDAKTADEFISSHVCPELPELQRFIVTYKGLSILLHFLCQWKSCQESLSNISDIEIIVIFMKYAMGQMFNHPAVFVSFNPHNNFNFDPNNLSTRPGGIGRILLGFFIVLSRDAFFDHAENWLSVPTFGKNIDDDFCDFKKWQLIHLAARDTYFKSVFQSSPSLLSSEAAICESTLVIGDFFTIEVSQDFLQSVNEKLFKTLCNLSGCKHIAWRLLYLTPSNEQREDYRIRVILWPRGTVNAIQRLRGLLTITPPISRNIKPDDLAFLMKIEIGTKLNNLLLS